MLQLLSISTWTMRSIAYLHSRGYVHRNVSSTSVLVFLDDSDCLVTVKLGSFGLARVLEVRAG